MPQITLCLKNYQMSTNKFYQVSDEIETCKPANAMLI